jgi:hypothetical protein
MFIQLLSLSPLLILRPETEDYLSVFKRLSFPTPRSSGHPPSFLVHDEGMPLPSESHKHDTPLPYVLQDIPPPWDGSKRSHHTSSLCASLCVNNIKTTEKPNVNRFTLSRLYASKVVYFPWNMIILLKRGWNVKTELHLPGAWKFHSERNK